MVASAWGGPAFLGLEAEKAFLTLARVSLLSAVVTCLVVALGIDSLPVAFLALWAPVLAFPLAWCVYSLLTGDRTLGVMQTTGLLIVLGLGVDDMFIISAAVKEHGRAHKGGMRARVGHALRTSAMAVSITSVTDALAFGCNVFAPIAAVREYGLFLAILVLVNFALVVLTFPALLLLFGGDSAVPPRPGFLARMDLARVWLPIARRGRVPILCATLLAAVGCAASLRHLRLDTQDYRLAAFGEETNLRRVFGAYQELATSTLRHAPSASADAFLGQPVWPAKAPLHVVWGSLAEAGGVSAPPSDASGPPARPLSAWDAPALQRDLARVCREASALPGISSSACLGEHFADWRRALNRSYPVPTTPELSAALCTFSQLTFGSADGCDAECAGAECAAFRATAPPARPARGWHEFVRWAPDGAHAAPACGTLSLLLADLAVGGRPYYASGASLRPIYDSVERVLGGGATLVHEQLAQMRVEETLLESTAVSALAAFSAACGAVHLALRDARVTALVAAHVLFILLASLASMVWMGWSVGVSEAMMFTVSTGLSIDFVLHIAIGFTRAPPSLGSYKRTHAALSELGVSVAQGAATTAIAFAFLVYVPLRPVHRFGYYIMANQAVGLATAVVPFTTALLCLGDAPDRDHASGPLALCIRARFRRAREILPVGGAASESEAHLDPSHRALADGEEGEKRGSTAAHDPPRCGQKRSEASVVEDDGDPGEPLAAAASAAAHC